MASSFQEPLTSYTTWLDSNKLCVKKFFREYRAGSQKTGTYDNFVGAFLCAPGMGALLEVQVLP